MLFLSSGWYIVWRPQFLVHIASLYLPHWFWNQVTTELRNNFCSSKTYSFYKMMKFNVLHFLLLSFPVVCDCSPPKGAKVCANKESCWQQIVSAQCWCQGWNKLACACIKLWDAKMQKNTKMQKCKNAKMQKCKNAKM